MRTYKDRIKLSLLPRKQGSASEPKIILVPIDFSPTSKKALFHAVRLAEKSGAGIILLHVIELLPLQVALGGVPSEVKKDGFKLIRQAEEVLARLGRETIDASIQFKAVIRVGVPYQAIVEVARNSAVDLVVITTHGYTGLRRAFQDGTAERVARHAPCAVLVLRYLR